MNYQYLKIKASCRNGLLKYLERATSTIPKIENPIILDVGCGSGAATIFILDKLGGIITAVDPDPGSIDFLRERATELGLINKIVLSNSSLFDLKGDNTQFDLVLAEGLLNIVGFEKGFLHITRLTKRDGFIIIHDGYPDREKKTRFIADNGCELLQSFVLDEQIWWNDYYKCLEKEVSAITDKGLLKLFESDLMEMAALKKNPADFKSVYYIVKKI